MTTHKTSRSKRRTVPDWQSVQRGEDAGKTLAQLWQDRAASAALPYGVSAFRKEFRKWQALAPTSPIEEYARVAIRPDILHLVLHEKLYDWRE